MSAGHSHDVKPGTKNERALWLSLLITTGFLIAEVVAGIMTGSLALISDAAHMFTDSAALAIALAAVRIGKRPADTRRTFGYYRFEILAAAFNAVLLFMVALYIIFEAYQRLKNPVPVQSIGMLVVAILGLAVNLVSMRLLSVGKDSSINMKGAYLEVWSDMLGSIGVIIAALIIHFTGWGWVDSAIAVGIGLWVLPRTWSLLKESINVLLEGVPDEVRLGDVDAAIQAISGVTSVHDLHIWAISSDKNSLSVHVVHTLTETKQYALLQSVRAMLAAQFDIHHSTVQLENVPCGQADSSHQFLAASPDLEASKVS